MKSEHVTQAWEFCRDNCQGFKEPMRKQFRKLDDYVSGLEDENAKLRRLLSSALIGAGYHGRQYVDAYLREKLDAILRILDGGD